MTAHTCFVCSRLELCKRGDQPLHIVDLKSGTLVFGDYQDYRGYVVFIARDHVEHIDDMHINTRIEFLLEMSFVCQAIRAVYQCARVNAELLGNTHHHLHWHIFPRRDTDMAITRPVWENRDLSKKITGDEDWVKSDMKRIVDCLTRVAGLN